MVPAKHTHNKSRIMTLVFTVLMLWLGLVLVLGARGAYARAPGSLPLPILFGVIVPIGAFLLMFVSWPAFRGLILSLDLNLVTAIQAWRFGGLGFLALYAYGVLPGMFAWPAGLGDLAIGASAVWVVRALNHRPEFAACRSFAIWNVLGILDLDVAVGIGAAASSLALGVYGEITTLPMTQMPLVLVPGFLVPLFVMLHLTALFQARWLSLFGSSDERALQGAEAA